MRADPLGREGSKYRREFREWRKERMVFGIRVLGAVCVVLFSLTSNAHAYLDPGSGSMLLQVVLGGIAGAVVLLKLFWRRVLSLFGLGREESD